jgi:hypothetical protein
MSDDYTPIGREPDYFTSDETQKIYWLSQIAKQLDQLSEIIETHNHMIDPEYKAIPGRDK